MCRELFGEGLTEKNLNVVFPPLTGFMIHK